MRESPKHNAAYSFKRRNTNPENCSNVCSMAFANYVVVCDQTNVALIMLILAISTFLVS